jgi:hypothetical protein
MTVDVRIFLFWSSCTRAKVNHPQMTRISPDKKRIFICAYLRHLRISFCAAVVG